MDTTGPTKVYSFTFAVPGTYTYSCAYHSTMAGTIVVKPGVTTTPEFPAAWLAVILFAVIAAVMLVAPRLRPSRIGAPLA
jgi:FtsP/CotA-like multicopper oxidase with cupredoxin domain